jgi:hypothetical protein
MDRMQPSIAEPLVEGLTGVGTPTRTVLDDDPLGVGFPRCLRPALDKKPVSCLAGAHGFVTVILLPQPRFRHREPLLQIEDLIPYGHV